MINQLRRCGIAAALFAACAAFTARPAEAAFIYMLSSGDAALDTQTQAVLASGGHTVTVGPAFTAFTGDGLAGQDGVVMLANANWNTGDMPALGQSALVSYVLSGGGLMTSEWTIWKSAPGNNELSVLSAVFPVVPNANFASDGGLTYTLATADAILNAGLPGAFNFVADSFSGTETQFAAKPGATVFYGSDGSADGEGVIGWDIGAGGRVLQFSTLMGPAALADANYARLVANGATWIATTPAAVPEPSSMLLLSLCGVVGGGAAWRNRRRQTA